VNQTSPVKQRPENVPSVPEFPETFIALYCLLTIDYAPFQDGITVGDFWQIIRKHFEDLAIALVIVFKEILFAFVVFGGGHALGWAVRRWSGNGEHIGGAIAIISDIGSVLLFVVLVSKDLKEYFKNR
jgi:hypothetical protein